MSSTKLHKNDSKPSTSIEDKTMNHNDDNDDEMIYMDNNYFKDNFDPIDHSLKISRHFITLLEEYRYLTNCFFKTCACHVNFDYQFFLRRLDDRYKKLSYLITSNEQVSELLAEDDDDYPLEHLIQLQMAANSLICPKDSSGKKLIQRPKICYDKRQNVNSSSPQMPLEDTSEPESQDHNPDDPIIRPDIMMRMPIDAFKCPASKCEFLSLTLEGFLEHQKTHSGTNLLSSFEINKRDVLHVCDQCGKEFAGQKWLENHIENVHAFAKIFACDHPGCQYTTKFRCVMDDHRRRHTKSKEFRCTWPDCESKFVTRRDMLAHVNFYHKGIRNYFCNWPTCAASFKDSNRLKHHYYTHTGERPYKCDFPGCEASFKQAPHLNKHKKVHGISKTSNNNDDNTDNRPKMQIQLEQIKVITPNSFQKSCSDLVLPVKKFEDQEHCEVVDQQEQQFIIKVEDDGAMECIVSGCHELFPNKQALTEHLSEQHFIKEIDDSYSMNTN